MASSGVCLDVAIDHRIRHLLKPRSNSEVNSLHGNHVQALQQLHPFVYEKGVKALPELLVTEELAKPFKQGGFVVALLRPADYHPFSDGVEVVVEKSPTLRALRDVFGLIGLDLVKQVTVLDSLPFLPRKDKAAMFGNDEGHYKTALKEHHDAFLEAVVAKRPDVVLCMWRTSEEPGFEWSGGVLGCEGVGELFDDEKITLCDRHGNRIETQRVNAFHPSHCMNYVREYGQLRQLLMLEIAHAWHLMDRSWREEPWMAELRNSWKEKTNKLKEEKRRGCKTELHDVYAKAVTKIQDLLPELSSNDARSETLYNKLIKAKWTQHMNDASLCLKAAAREYKNLERDTVNFHDTTGPQGDMASRTMGLVLNLAMKLGSSEKMEPRMHQGNGIFSTKFLEHLQDEKTITRGCWFRNSILKRGLIDFLLGLNKAFSDAEVQGPIRLQMSLVSASEAFLTVACEMEGLLSILAGYPEEEVVTEDETEQEANPNMHNPELWKSFQDMNLV